MEKGQQVMRVAHCRGQNLYDAQDACGFIQTFELPKRLRHLVFIRPGSYVFARIDETRGEGVVKGDIEVVILDCFLPALRKTDYWPSEFKKTTARNVSSAGAPSTALGNVEHYTGEGSDVDDVLEMGGNPNRASWAYLGHSTDEE